MQDYKVVTFKETQQQNDILIALLSQLNYNSFEEIDDNTLDAYILKEDYSENEVKEILQQLESFKDIQFLVKDLENKNWNEEWEKSFKPIKISDKCVVRAPFHDATNAKFELLIEPKMAFGTGHHATTEMMLKLMLDIDFKEKNVLDFGAGTGILSLLASKMGAKNIVANDIEEDAFENMKENF
ncbi:MAG: 50S ribosomal protein L11 methyltransferase, partial [Bacteroidetes bacterium]|nr:50S ribosomal protein L11 methyltransferase [Bacteroidota bacterium]